MKTKVLMMLSLFTVLAVTCAYGQVPVRATISFQFTAGGKVLPAGQYEFLTDAEGQSLKVAAVPRGPSAIVMVGTRLAMGVHTVEEPHIVFDKVRGDYLLSELWVPGEDGFQLHTTKEKHEHEIVHGRR